MTCAAESEISRAASAGEFCAICGFGEDRCGTRRHLHRRSWSSIRLRAPRCEQHAAAAFEVCGRDLADVANNRSKKHFLMPAPKSSAGKKSPRARGARIAAGEDPAVVNSTPGRPSLFRKEFIQQAEDLCMLGLKNEELAQFFKVDPPTVADWIRDIPEFAQAVYNGREGADIQVARALFLRAKGYEHEAVDIKAVAVGNNQGSEIVETIYTKRYPPDTGAAALWLGNRQRARWRNEGDQGGLSALEIARLMRQMSTGDDDEAAPDAEG